MSTPPAPAPLVYSQIKVLVPGWVERGSGSVGGVAGARARTVDAHFHERVGKTCLTQRIQTGGSEGSVKK